MLKVAKFGGSSVAGANQFRKVKAIVEADPARRIVVASAAGKRSSDDHKLTDLLYLCHAHLTYGVSCEEILTTIRERFVEIKNELSQMGTMDRERSTFIRSVRKFMEMDVLTAPLLQELIERIEIHETEGKGKDRTQHIVIYYQFVGYLEYPRCPWDENIRADTREGVTVEYIPEAI